MSNIVRLDKYTISIDGVSVFATEDQEQKIREMTAEEQENFVKLMSGKK